MITGNIGAWVAFKKCAPLIKYITKAFGTTIDKNESLDLVMTMYDLLKAHSQVWDHFWQLKTL